MAALQIRRRSVHAVVEAIQDESSSGESAFETPGAGAAVGCGGGYSDKEVEPDAERFHDACLLQD